LYQFPTGTPSEQFPFILQVTVYAFQDRIAIQVALLCFTLYFHTDIHKERMCGRIEVRKQKQDGRAVKLGRQVEARTMQQREKERRVRDDLLKSGKAWNTMEVSM
jgi:hypothetical protein